MLSSLQRHLPLSTSPSMQTISLPYFRIPTSPRCQHSFLSLPFPLVLHNHFLLLLLLLLWDEEFWKSSDPFHSEEKNETRHFPLFFPFLIIITLFHRSPRKPDSNTSRQLHCSNRVDISKLFSVALIYICIFVKAKHETFLYTRSDISSLLGMHLGHRPSLNDTNGR